MFGMIYSHDSQTARICLYFLAVEDIHFISSLLEIFYLSICCSCTDELRLGDQFYVF